MAAIFDITGDDIKDLKDDDLRDLIGRLCELDYHAAKLGTSGITWGGNQDSGDGGLDVAVRGMVEPPLRSYVPRKYTGFQVKKPAMGPADIRKEMKPDGQIRDSIKTLITEKGAYIIVSSGASTTDSAITKRKDAMRAAVSDIEHNDGLLLDFYDCGRIASWVRSHPTLVTWVREKIGRPMVGWRAYENWARSPETDDVYLLSEGIKVYREDNQGVAIIDAINALRVQLSAPQKCIRLVGLSGVGKTRFVQALFDSRIGIGHLHQSTTIYTDISDSPSPDPVTLAKELFALQSQAVLIVDNCPPDLHRRLVNVVTAPQSRVSLITVEYDVRDDLPEETDVYRLEPADDRVITQLVERRFPHIKQVDARSIAEFSGGNARIAIALANTVRKGETLGRLRDEELFKRLFDQSNERDKGLLKSAGALALVYSFNGTDIEAENSELSLLAAIIEQPLSDLYSNVAELQSRQLVQSRSIWRAVLPHAIANRLAQQTLKATVESRILSAFAGNGQERILQSFTRRLSYLHDSAEAKKIAMQWVMPDGFLDRDNGNLHKAQLRMLENIAPVVPEEVLNMFERMARGINFERFLSRENEGRDTYVRLLRLLAYDPALFTRCADLLSQFVTHEEYRNSTSSAKDVICSLFYLYLSGTHASAEIRAEVIKRLFRSADEKKQALALELLEATYEASHFTAYHDFSFGARPRDMGWEPQSDEDKIYWYGTFISLGLSFVQSHSSKSEHVKRILADSLFGLLQETYLVDELERLCDQLLLMGPWNEGWIEVRRMLRSHRDDEWLKRFEEKLRPSNLQDLIRAHISIDTFVSVDLQESAEINESQARIRAQEFYSELGHELASHPKILSTLLPELITARSGYIKSLAVSLTAEISDRMRLWRSIKEVAIYIPEKQINKNFLIGVLSSGVMDTMREELMDAMVDDTVFAPIYPEIQAAMSLTPSAFDRLHRSLDLNVAPANAYTHICWNTEFDSLSDDYLVPYLKKITTKDEGIFAAHDIILTRLNHSKREPSGTLTELIREVLLNIPYDDHSRRPRLTDYSLGTLISKSMGGGEAQVSAKRLCEILVNAVKEHHLSTFHWPQLFSRLAKSQPDRFLEIFLNPEHMKSHGIRQLFGNFNRQKNPLDQIDDALVISWCEKDPIIRYPLATSALSVFKHTSDTPIEWRPIVYEIIERAPNIAEILPILGKDIVPTSWSGSRTDIILERSKALSTFFDHPNEVVSSWAKKRFDEVLMQAEEDRGREERHDIFRNETFE